MINKNSMFSSGGRWTLLVSVTDVDQAVATKPRSYVRGTDDQAMPPNGWVHQGV